MNLVRFDAFRELEQMSTPPTTFFAAPRWQLEVDALSDRAPATATEATDKDYLLQTRFSVPPGIACQRSQRSSRIAC